MRIEQKRRQAIREGFDRLTELVPGLEGQGRSEGLVLKRTVEFLREKIEERRTMVERIEQAGGEVDEKLKR
jgi:septum formation protein